MKANAALFIPPERLFISVSDFHLFSLGLVTFLMCRLGNSILGVLKQVGSESSGVRRTPYTH